MIPRYRQGSTARVGLLGAKRTRLSFISSPAGTTRSSFHPGLPQPRRCRTAHLTCYANGLTNLSTGRGNPDARRALTMDRVKRLYHVWRTRTSQSEEAAGCRKGHVGCPLHASGGQTGSYKRLVSPLSSFKEAAMNKIALSPNSLIGVPALEYIDALVKAGYDGIGLRTYASPGVELRVSHPAFDGQPSSDA